MNRYGLVLASTALLLAACGGKDTMASKSAAAYREAAAKGTPVTGGDGHGHEHAAPATMDHSAHATAPDAHVHMQHEGTEHAGMDHAAMGHSAADHAAMQHSATADHSSMDHSSMDHSSMDHSTIDHSTMDHSKMDHSTMDHGATASATSAHAHHGAALPAARANVVLNVPNTNAEIAQTRPAATLQTDPFDAPAPSAVSEAQKAAGGGGGHGHGQ